MSLITGPGRYLTRDGKEVDVFRSGKNFYPWVYKVSGAPITVDDDGYQLQSGNPTPGDIIAKAPGAAPAKEETPKLDDGGPAFPTPEPNIPEGHYYVGPGAHPGMSLRDYFAAMAMQGFCVNGGSVDGIVKESWRIADAMIKAGRAA